MKYFLLLSFLLVACQRNPSGDDNGNDANYGIQVMTVNKCQYILYLGGGGSAMVHAGNCNNPEHD